MPPEGYRYKPFAIGYTLQPSVGNAKVTRNFEANTRWDDIAKYDGGNAEATLSKDGRVVVRVTRPHRDPVEFELKRSNALELQALIRTLEAVKDELAERRS